ncbi:hypothetical protein CDAR_435551 [Caerostris darwini]|uniref:Uncharacterized protein n=1 Tax=Caerostris darwini TaxID=1538125 RepID=A0AAV4VJK1_9ARAC|nr:hypothetical protein CDAR_435551 [Caerostris darwini]
MEAIVSRGTGLAGTIEGCSPPPIASKLGEGFTTIRRIAHVSKLNQVSEHGSKHDKLCRMENVCIYAMNEDYDEVVKSYGSQEVNS